MKKINPIFKKIQAFNVFIITVLIFIISSCVASQVVITDDSLEKDTLSPRTEETVVDKENNELNITDDIKEEIDERILSFFSNIEIENKDFLVLTEADKRYLIDLVYSTVNDFFLSNTNNTDVTYPEKFNDINKKVYVRFLVNNQKRGSYSAKENNLAETVYNATIKTLNDDRYGGTLKESEINGLKISIYIIGDEKILDDGYEKGIHGLRLEKNGKSATYYNSVAIEGNYKLSRLIEKLCSKAGLENDCADDPDTKVYYFPTIHFGTTPYSEDIVTFYRSSEISYFPIIDYGAIKFSFDMAENHMASNLNNLGYFNYFYYPANGNYSDDNNMIRQLMSSRWLSEKSNYNPDLSDLHKKNLDYIFKNWYREDNDFGYIYFKDESKLGAISTALRVLLYSPYYEDYHEEAQKLINSILSMQRKDGSFKAFFIEPDGSYDEVQLLKYYSGQTIIALFELYKKTGDKKFLEAAILSQDYFLDFYLETMDTAYSPSLIPWHTMSLYKLYTINKDERYKDAIFIFNDKLIKKQNQDGKPYIDYLGRFGTNSTSTGVYTEGLCYAYRMAELVNDKARMYEYKKAILLGAHNLMNLQFIGADMYYIDNRELVEGAIKTSESNNSFRVDNTQHMIDAFNEILKIWGED